MAKRILDRLFGDKHRWTARRVAEHAGAVVGFELQLESEALPERHGLLPIVSLHVVMVESARAHDTKVSWRASCSQRGTVPSQLTTSDTCMTGAMLV